MSLAFRHLKVRFMTLPRKKSRLIEVDSKKYRWLISKRSGTINLSIEVAEHSGQLLQICFEPHDSYKRGTDNQWERVKQGVSVTPKLVNQIIQHGLVNGWHPNETGKTPFYIYIWKADDFIPELPEPNHNELRLKDMAIEQVSNLRFDLSLDPLWRKQLFDAPIYQRFALPSDYFALTEDVRNCGLRFAAFKDGWKDDGFVVFGIESVDFPDLVMYSTNNPEII